NRAGISTAVPSSSGGAACTGGVMRKGNSGSGAAAAEPENAIVPIASAPKATAARREFSFNASRLNIARPCFRARQFGVSLTGISTGQRFQEVCVKRQNGFVGAEKCFVAGS